MSMAHQHKALILIVEDDDRRVAKLNEWLPDSFRLVHVKSGGQAIGVLNRSHSFEFAGVMLDYDLDIRPERGVITGAQVAEHVLCNVDSSTPILVHSANDKMAPFIVGELADQFSVTRINWTQMTEGIFLRWLREVHEEWEDRLDLFEEHDDRNFNRTAAFRGDLDWLTEMSESTNKRYLKGYDFNGSRQTRDPTNRPG